MNIPISQTMLFSCHIARKWNQGHKSITRYVPVYYWAHFKKGAYFESSLTSVVILSETLQSASQVNTFREIAMKEPKASLIGPKRANIDLWNVEIWNITILRRFIHIHLLYACIRCFSKPLYRVLPLRVWKLYWNMAASRECKLNCVKLQ